MLQCGLVRSNFSLAIVLTFSPPDAGGTFAKNGASGIAGRAGVSDLGPHRTEGSCEDPFSVSLA
jgi:hypothetical protein